MSTHLARPILKGQWWSIPLEPDARERRVARWGLVAAALGLLVLHVVFAGLDRPVNWDEAIHLSQVNPAVPAVFMEPHRTRGLSWIVAPVAVFDPPMIVLRFYLALLNAVATYAAFAAWVRTIGVAAPIAAVVYSTYWVTVFYSVEVLPNQPAALLTVGIVGLAVAAIRGTVGRWDPAVVGVAFLLFAALRPPDAVLVGAGLAAIAVVVRTSPVIVMAGSAALGGIAGIVPWLVEGRVRFGFTPLGTVRSAGEYSVNAERINLLPLYLESLQTRLRCAGSCLEDYAEAGAEWSLPPNRALLFLVAAACLALIAVAASGKCWWVALAPVAFVVPLLGFYGFGGGAMNLRYLMPVFALLLIPPSIGLRAVWRLLGTWPPLARFGLRSLMIIALIMTSSWSTSQALDRFENPSTRDRAAAIGEVLAAVVAQDGPSDCVLAARGTYPQLQYWSGCRAVAAGSASAGEIQPPLGELHSYVDLAAAVAGGAQAYAVDRAELHENSPLRDWERIEPDGGPIEGLVIYRHLSDSDLPPPPCPSETGPERTLAEVLGDRC